MANAIPDHSMRAELAVRYDCDARSILAEARVPGSVRGRAGRRAREALAYWQAMRELSSGSSTAPVDLDREAARLVTNPPPPLRQIWKAAMTALADRGPWARAIVEKAQSGEQWAIDLLTEKTS